MCLVWKENGIGFSSFGFQNNSHRVLHGYTFFHPKPNRVFLSNPDPNRTRTDPSQFKSFVFQNIFKFLNLYLVPNIYITFTFIILNK